MRSIAFIWLLITSACFAGYDHSVEVRIDGWEISIDTAGIGLQGERVVTRVFLSHKALGQGARMELPADALPILWKHLEAVPKTERAMKRLSLPSEADGVVLGSDRFSRLEVSKALPLIRLWLDTNRVHWVAPADAKLQAALRGSNFPPPIPARESKDAKQSDGGGGR